MKKLLFAAGLLLLAALPANAATCFWVGGTGTWDNATDAAHWSSSTGGSGSTCAATGGHPSNSVDVATFDGSSGGGTVTVNVNMSINSITSGAFTGTLDWSANNNNVALAGAWNNNSTGTRTINMGSGAWSITDIGNGATIYTCTSTGLTLTGTGSFTVSGSAATDRIMTLGSCTLPYLTISTTGGGLITLTGSGTITTLNASASANFNPGAGTTVTVTNAATWTGTSSTPIGIGSFGSANGTLSLGAASTCTWCVFKNVTVSGSGSMTGTNSLNLGGNTNITINPPNVVGGGFVGILGGGI